MMPEVFPRVSSLFFSGFGILPYLLALLCARARLLPKGHRFFLAGEKYGIRHVLAEAALHLEFKWKNIDQIIVYATLLAAATLVFGFFAVVLSFFVFSTAEAATWVPGMFQTANPTHDVAFMMLDRVFGIPGIYDSEIITNPAKYGPAPNAFQLALQELFGFFSWGLFSIAVFIFLYFVVEIVWDITQKGEVLSSISDDVTAPYESSPEKGFAWIPLRMVLALGLLLPISNGFNSAQYITLYIAKFGSGMATNAWGYFNMETGANPMGLPNEELVANLEPQDYTNVLKGLMILKSCYGMNNWNVMALAGSGLPADQDGSQGSYDVSLYVINGTQNKPLFAYGAAPPPSFFGPDGNKYMTTPSGVISSAGTDPFSKILAFSGGQGISIVLGYTDPSDPTKFSDYPGGVLPVCGEVMVPVSGFNGEALFAAEAYFYSVLYVLKDMPRRNDSLSAYEEDSLLAVLRDYSRTSSGYRQFMQMMVPARDCLFDTDLDGFESFNESGSVGNYLGPCMDAIPAEYWKDYLNVANVVFANMPIEAARSYLVDDPFAASIGNTARYIGDTAHSSLGIPNPMMLTTAMVELGWGGAGRWYNRISEKNGSLVSAVGAAPSIRKMPMVMEKVKEERLKNDKGVGKGMCDPYSPEKSGTTSTNIANEKTQFSAESAKLLHGICRTLFENQNIVVGSAGAPGSKPENAIEKSMSAVFGQLKLFDVRENDKVLPMAQLSAVGKMLIDKSILSMTAAVGTSLAGGAQHMMAMSADGEDIASTNMMGEAFGEASSALLSFATLGLTIGVVLHYVLPFLPFMYFFFAVGRWVKTIFEAMVGVPLWAMAHLRRSGHGLPGDAASSGYFLLLEIFVRPIVTIVSLVGAYAVFTAMVMVLNSIFLLLVSNFGGADVTSANPDIISSVRGIVDQFFYSVMYVLLSYMIAISCFKLIDIIPDNIMRWSGAGVSSMGASDNADDLIDQLQYQMPMAVRYFAKEFGETVREGLYNPGRELGLKAQKEYNEVKGGILNQLKRDGQISVSDAKSKFGGDRPDYVDSALRHLETQGHVRRDGSDYYWTKKK